MNSFEGFQIQLIENCVYHVYLLANGIEKNAVAASSDSNWNTREARTCAHIEERVQVRWKGLQQCERIKNMKNKSLIKIRNAS